MDTQPHRPNFRPSKLGASPGLLALFLIVVMILAAIIAYGVVNRPTINTPAFERNVPDSKAPPN